MPQASRRSQRPPQARALHKQGGDLDAPVRARSPAQRGHVAAQDEPAAAVFCGADRRVPK